MAKSKKTGDIVVKGLQGQVLIIDAHSVEALVEQHDDKTKTFVILKCSQMLSLPYGIVQVDHILRQARGQGIRPGTNVQKPKRKSPGKKTVKRKKKK